MINEDALKQRIQRWIVCGSVAIMAGKFLAFWLTNSVGILTDAVESIVNVTAGFISLYSLYLAAKPKDAGHPFGHGKVELISASIEGLLIIIAGGVIIFEGVRRLFEPAEIAKLDIGIIVVAAAGAMNYLMGWYSIRMGRRYNSIALIAGGKHLQSDTYSTIGLAIGLILLYITRIGWIDIHTLKMIKYGSGFFIDCDLTLPWYYNIEQGHEACEALRRAIEKGFSDRITLSVHSDSCKEKHCEHCRVADCPYRRQPFTTPLVYTLNELTQTDEQRNE